MLALLLTLVSSLPLEQARALEEAGEAMAAQAVLQSAVRQEPSWAVARLELGRLQLRNGSPDSALHHLDVARSLAPENPRAHYFYGLAAYEVGLRNQSRAAFEVALALRNGFSDAQLRLALVMVEDGEPLSAVSPLRQYLKVHPTSNGARFQLADALERGGEVSQAEAELRSLLTVFPVRELAARKLVSLLHNAGRTSDAEKVRQLVATPKRSMRELQRSRR